MFSTDRQRLVEAVSSVLGEGKVALLAFPVDGAPDLPWAVYSDDPSVMGADDGNWSVTHRWTVELYERQSDSTLEERLLEALAEVYGYVEPQGEIWNDDEGCYMVAFRFNEIKEM